MQIIFRNQTYRIEDACKLYTLAERFQDAYDAPIVLANVDGRLRELHHTVPEGATLEFVTTADKIGHMTYQRSCSMLFFAACYALLGREKIDRIVLHFSAGDGWYYTIEGDVEITESLISSIGEKMKEMAAREIPIKKRSLSTDEAVDHFRRRGFYDKEKLFATRMASRINIYELDGYEDYYYGYMVRHTGYLGVFGLFPCHDGILLQMPSRGDVSVLPPVRIDEKYFLAQLEGEHFAAQQGFDTVADLNSKVIQFHAREVIQVSEAMQEAQIARIADDVSSRDNVKFVMIAGPSSSGKTTFSQRLCVQLRAKGLMPHYIGVDNYFIDREQVPLDEDGKKDYESLHAVDLELFNRDMRTLLEGGEIDVPTFDFISGKRIYKGERLKLSDNELLVIEGIHCLNDELSVSLPGESKYKIYISALTQLNIDDHNRIPTTDGRLLRRMVRDYRTRGYDAGNTLDMWYSVRKGEDQNIFPYQESADFIFNSALPYETAVLKAYVQPLLFQVPKDHPEYAEAKRLLKFLDYFLVIPADDVPQNSILREFIGGGSFHL